MGHNLLRNPGLESLADVACMEIRVAESELNMTNELG